MKNKACIIPHVSRLRVAFFQRVFAHYQAGLVKELAQNSVHEYHFFGDSRDPLGSGIEPMPEELRNEVSFAICKTIHWGKYLAFQWRAVSEALLSDFDAYIFEGSFTILSNWLAIPIARIRGKRVLLYSHGWLNKKTGLIIIIRNLFYRLADGLLLYGKRARKIGIDYSFSPDKLYVVYNSLDDDEIQKWRYRITPVFCKEYRKKWFSVNADKPIIVNIGRLNSAKKNSLLLRAAAQMNREGQNINILLVGDGPERNALEHLAKEMGIRLVCTGARYDEEFLSICFSAADITVIPGAAGLTVIHSLSYGTPVVVHNDADSQMPESEAVVDGVSGAIFRSGDVDALARSIKKVLQNLPISPQVVAQCRSIVDAAYTPLRMRIVFDDAVSGCPAKRI